MAASGTGVKGKGGTTQVHHSFTTVSSEIVRRFHQINRISHASVVGKQAIGKKAAQREVQKVEVVLGIGQLVGVNLQQPSSSHLETKSFTAPTTKACQEDFATPGLVMQ